MIDYATGAPHTYHTLNPVPFILVPPDGSPLHHATLRTGGRVCHITPTILRVMNLELAPEMTCATLIT
jgi:2,3-bisphosphoglycerate-independent phosphoglycerate mutase